MEFTFSHHTNHLHLSITLLKNSKSFDTSLTTTLAGHSLKGSTFGAFMQLHKVLILLCICTLTQKFTFLRKGPKSLKDKLFCSFNEVFVFIEIFGF